MLDEWPRKYPVDEAYSAVAGLDCHKVVYGDYLVFYKVDNKAKAIYILAFIHGKHESRREK